MHASALQVADPPRCPSTRRGDPAILSELGLRNNFVTCATRGVFGPWRGLFRLAALSRRPRRALPRAAPWPSPPPPAPHRPRPPPPPRGTRPPRCRPRDACPSPAPPRP